MDNETLELIKYKIKVIELFTKKMETASVEDKVYCYQPKIEALKDDINLLCKEKHENCIQ